MKVVPITRNALALDTDDWKRLNTLMTDFDYVCDSQSCDSCPLEKVLPRTRKSCGVPEESV